MLKSGSDTYKTMTIYILMLIKIIKKTLINAVLLSEVNSH